MTKARVTSLLNRKQQGDENKPMTPSDLRAKAQELIRTGKMPTPERFAEVMGEAQRDYVSKLKKIRESESEGE